MLKTLREHNVKITFFLTGKWIKENPDLVRQIVADGHEIANHTFTHPDLTQPGRRPIRKELADTEALMQETAGATTRPLFRPPYGAYDERVLRMVAGQGYLPIYWTLDSLDLGRRAEDARVPVGAHHRCAHDGKAARRDHPGALRQRTDRRRAAEDPGSVRGNGI